MTSKQDIQTTSGGKERIAQTVAILTAAFKDDPVYAYFLVDLPEEKRQPFLSTLLTAFTKASTLNGGLILEAGPWGSCAILIPPGRTIDNPRTILRAGILPILKTLKISGCKRFLIEYPEGAKRAKEKGMTKRERAAFWYLFHIGTLPSRQGQGLAGALIERMKDLARGDGGRPIWLEASTPKSRAVYARHGFRDVDEVVLGKGRVGPDGRAEDGGDGVMVYAMIWRPEEEKLGT
ncbi:hypothetical protein F5X96DRAFT_624360 [Biscogniauxia mediterranea]|nr:hypothetical protein F5X96DRAFT_624360 [Biscogniauxia mediterranea]